MPPTQWQPTATLQALRQRAQILAQIRHFFAERNILEVETPLLSHATVTAPHLHSISATVGKTPCYLQTSPEYAMKRLLAAGSGSIFQISKAFRQDEQGRIHNPEFTMLEWYHIDFDHHALMDEVDALLQLTLNTPPADRYTYAEIFKKYLDIVPPCEEEEISSPLLANYQGSPLNLDDQLNYLMSHHIEPHLGQDRPTFIYDYPASQAALARIRPDNPPVASRFEVYYHGIELGNGFHELQSHAEQRTRFEQELAYRAAHQLPSVPIDENLLAALAHGLPDCAGIAIGIDRLVMLALGYKNLTEVLSLDFPNA